MISFSLSSVAYPPSVVEAYGKRDLYAGSSQPKMVAVDDVQLSKHLDHAHFSTGGCGAYVGAPPRTPNEERKLKKKNSKRMVKCVACGHCHSQESYSVNQWTKPCPVCRKCIKLTTISVYSA